MKNIFSNPKLNAALSQKKLSFALEVAAFAVIGFIVPWWWSIALVAFVVGWTQNTLSKACLRALIACFTAWFLLTVGFDIMNGFRISMRLGGIVGLPIPIAANLLASALGGIFAMLVAGAANQIRVVSELVRLRE
jgi:hypothetical protein